MRRACVVVLAAVSLAACSGQSDTTATPPSVSATPTASTPTTASPTPPAIAARTVWLCRPGHQPDPCVSDLTTTVIDGSGHQTTEPDPRTTRHPRPEPADCFYAYPTVSGESGANADLRIQAAERQVALVQAARFSAVCDVWSPMYRQRTLGDLFDLTDGAPDSKAHQIAYESLRSGWLSFLAAHDPARPIVLIGHSQGASMLIRLLRNEIDHEPAVRRQIAVALVLGGNLTVARGTPIGGDLQHIPLCTKPGESGCVIAYSTFPGQPPAGAFFGRPGSGVSLLSGNVRTAGLQVACVNPVSPGSHAALGLHPYFPTALAHSGMSTPWTAYPDHATAQCRTGAGATWLQVSPTPAGRKTAQLLHERLGALWGFHDIDVNLTLGDLVADVSASVAGWHRRH
ncbi:MAG TPA: DUF3089 domain-containing protein [Mycobacteriales bacterium]|nr:DUF3089 domain-containing protein [Mycobacteriales bacterium]